MAAALVLAACGNEESADKLPPAPLNKTFDFLFGLERYAIGLLPFPPGVSLVAIAEDAGGEGSGKATPAP